MNAFLVQFKIACFNLLGIGRLFITFPFSKKARWTAGRVHAVLSNPFVTERIALSAFLPDPFEVTVVPLKCEAHNTSEYELLCLAALTKALNIQHVFEIGTFDGRSTRAIARNVGTEGSVTTLNLPPGKDKNDAGTRNVDSLLNTKVISGYRFHNTQETKQISQVFGDSASFDFAPFKQRMDMVFIDGSHAVNYVRQDTASAQSLIKPEGGWIIWHDAPLYGVAPFLIEQISLHHWQIRLIEGTTLAIAYCKAGLIVDFPIE